jgi:hypothetical protein
MLLRRGPTSVGRSRLLKGYLKVTVTFFLFPFAFFFLGLLGLFGLSLRRRFQQQSHDILIGVPFQKFVEVQPVKALFCDREQLLDLCSVLCLPLFQEPQGFANYFAGVAEPSRFNTAFHSTVEMPGQIDIGDRRERRAKGEEATVAILNYELARVPWRVAERAGELDALCCVLGVERVHIVDGQVGVEQFFGILFGIGRGRGGAAEMNGVPVAGNDRVDGRVVPSALTFEAELVFVIREGRGNVRGEELGCDLTDHDSV